MICLLRFIQAQQSAEAHTLDTYGIAGHIDLHDHFTRYRLVKWVDS